MMTSLQRERSYPWIAGMALAVVSWWFLPPSLYHKAVDQLVEPIITVSTLVFGFLLTIAGMLTSLERKSMHDLREAGLFPVLLGYIKSSMYVWVVVAVVSIIIGLVDQEPWLRYTAALWAGLTGTGFLTSHRVARIMFKILAGRSQTHVVIKDGEKGVQQLVRAGSSAQDFPRS